MPKPFNLLVIEDSRFDLELIVMTLKQGGLKFDLQHASNKDDFLTQLSQRVPDLILSDYQLPGFSGEAAFFETKNLGLDLPFILVTGALSDAAASRIQEIGIEDYVLKDRLGRLPSAVKKALKTHQVKHETKTLKEKVWKYRTRLSILHEVSPVGIFRMNQDGHCIYVNKKWCQISGLEKSEALGNRWVNAVHPEDREKVLEVWKNCLDENKPQSQCDYRFIKPDGSVVWVLCSVVRETDEAGKLSTYIGSVTDITESMLIRKELEENTLLFKEAISAGTIAVGEIKLPTQEFNAFNFDVILGYSPGEVPNQLEFYLNQIHPDEFPEAMENLQGLMRGDSTVYSDEKQFLCKDGTYKWLLIKCKVTQLAEGDTRLLGTLTDINEQKVAQKELLESKERFRSLLDNAYDEIFVLNPKDATLIEVNNSVVQNTGYTKEELIGNSLSMISKGQDNKLGQVIKELKSTGKARFDSIHERKNGEVYPMEVTARFINISGEDFILAFARDVSEKRKAEAEIKKLSLVASEIDNGVLMADKELKVEWVNNAFERMTGYELEDVKGKSPVDIFGQDDPEANAAIIQSIMAGKPIAVEMLIYTKNRERSLWIDLTITPLLSKQGEIEGVISISTDITERKQAERELRESEARFRTVLMEAPNAVIITDSKGGITFFNKQAEEYFGYNQVEIIEQDIEVLVNLNLKANKKHEKFSAINTSHLGKEKDVFAKRKDGSLFPIEGTLNPYATEGEKGLIVMVKDVTEQKLAEEEENRFKAMLELKVEERTKELNRINKLLEKEAEIRKKISEDLEQRNHDMTSSIIYAEKLQNAMLPSLRMFERSFNESFLINKPKDIVSGDFYWFHKTRQKIMIACADCTGHGVPGAFMSMMGVELLNKVVIEQEWKFPSLVLELLDEGIINTLKQGNVAMTDGMDISFCMIDKSENKLQFAGAMHSLVMVSEGKLTVHKGNRFGLGGYINSGRKKFETLEIDYKEGDMIYMFTDGFADQFGGDRNKKLMASRMKDWLLEVSELPAEKQQRILSNKHEDWQGANEQVDDILLVGIRL